MKNISNNRGYGFIDYHNNQCAEYSRQKMTSPSFKLGDNFPTVNWAEPKNADSSASSQVSIHMSSFILSSVDSIDSYG